MNNEKAWQASSSRPGGELLHRGGDAKLTKFSSICSLQDPGHGNGIRSGLANTAITDHPDKNSLDDGRMNGKVTWDGWRRDDLKIK